MTPANETDRRLPHRHFARVLAALAAMVAMAGFYAFGDRLPLVGQQDGTSEPPATRVLPVQTAEARQTPFYLQQRWLTGVIAARRSGDLRIPVSGRLDRLLVRQGETVEADQPLAELDHDRITEQRDQLDAALKRENEKLQRLIADSQFRSMESIREEVRALKLQLKQLKAEVESSPNASANTQGRLEDTQRRLRVLESVSRDPQVIGQQAVVAKLREQLAQLDAEIEEMTLLAPYRGMIGKQFVSEGALVSPSAPIMRIIEHEALEVTIGLPANIANGMQVGEQQTIVVGSEQLSVTLSALLPELDRTTRTRQAVFSVDPSSLGARRVRDPAASSHVVPGQVARMEISRRVDQIGFWLPITALTRQADGLWSVYELVEEDDGNQYVSRQYVEVVHVQGESVRVRGTLDDGAAVISEGTHRVVPGQIVTDQRTP